jgi:hypothetical protein
METIKSGDVIVFRTKFKWNKPMTWLAAIIRGFTAYEYNHVGVVVHNWGVPFLNESNQKGVNSTILKERLTGCKYKIFRSKHPIDEKAFCINANSKLGVTKYDTISLLFYHAWYKITGRWIASNKQNQNERFMVCSEYAAWCHNMKEWYKADPSVFEKSNYFIEISL